jgi:hypothetical protein
VSAVSDIFMCTSTLCPCVTGTFKASFSESQIRSAVANYFNSVHSNYGSYLTVTKETLDALGSVTTIAADVDSYKITFTGRFAIPENRRTTETKILTMDTTVTTATISKNSESTNPLSGFFMLRIPIDSSGATKDTDNIGVNWADGHVLRSIYKAAPEYIGKVEFKTDNSNYLSSDEGKEYYYRISELSYGDFEIINSSDLPLIGGSTTEPIALTADNNYSPASFEPFYEVIPGTMVRTFVIKPQIVVTSNNLVGACPTPNACDVTFIDNVAEITSRTNIADYSSLTFVGTSIPNSELTYASIGTLRK